MKENVWYTWPGSPRVQVLVTPGTTENKVRTTNTWICNAKPHLGTKISYRELKPYYYKNHSYCRFRRSLSGIGYKSQIDRLILETSIGRELVGNETVDHIDGDPRNHSLKNLQILSKEDNLAKFNNSNKERQSIQARNIFINKRKSSIWYGVKIKDSLGNIYNDIFEVYDKEKLNLTNIKDCIEGKRKTCGGRKWFVLYNKEEKDYGK